MFKGWSLFPAKIRAALGALLLTAPAALLRAAQEAAAGGFLQPELDRLDAANAATATAGASAQALEVPSLLPTLLQVAFALGFVIALVLLVYWLLLRWRDRQGLEPGLKVGLIKVLERQFIDGRHGVAVVEVGDEVLVLGLGDEVTLLATVTEPEAVERLRQMAPLPASVMGFKEQLERVGLRLKREEWGQAKRSLRTQADEMKEQMERLKGPRGGGR